MNLGPINMGGGPNLIQRSLFSTSTPTLPYSSWYTPGNGSPAISTADYYSMAGLILSRPYDLDTMGSEGAAIKAREGGKRYVWLMWTDHLGNWPGSCDLYAAYSNDPQVWPEPTTMRALIGAQNAISVVDQNGYTQNNFFVYWFPFLVYNPDPGAFAPFYIYAEGQSTSSSRQHELALITTSDFLSATLVGPTIPTTDFNGWTSLGQMTRLGTNSWEGYAFGKADATPVTTVDYKYTSTDGWAWTPNFTNIVAGPGPYLTISGQRYLLTTESADPNSYVSLLAVNSSNVSLGTYTRISTGFGSNGTLATSYPGPTYLQAVGCYEEDGVASIYVSRGFPVSSHDGTNSGPYLDNHPSFYNITASITSNVLDVTSWPAGNPPLAIGFRLQGLTTITGFVTGSGGVGQYTVAPRADVASTTMQVFTNGGLWQQFIDQYYLITDTTLAVDAAPLGVVANCVAGTVTVSWNNSLPNNTYRVYRGTTVGTQATLIGTITGNSITDTPTVGSQYFYKVVTMNSGVEKKSRIVNVYCSNNTLMVTRHVNRVINDGGDITKIDMTFLATADAWLTSNNTYRYLNWWTDVRFGIKLDGSGFIAKIYDLGTTYLPRGGDYTPTTSNTYPSTSSNTSYSTNSFRGTTPSWINNAGTARGYFGNGRANNIQRWSEITMLAAYQKPNTSAATFFGLGEFTGMYFQHGSGSTGNITFAMVCDKTSPSTFTNATVAFSSATAASVAAAVADGTNMIAYLNGTPGTPVSMGASANNGAMLKDTVLRGQYSLDVQSEGQGPVLASGSHDTRFSYTARTYNFGNSEAQFTGAGLAVFNKGLSQSLVQSWGALYA